MDVEVDVVGGDGGREVEVTGLNVEETVLAVLDEGRGWKWRCWMLLVVTEGLDATALAVGGRGKR